MSEYGKPATETAEHGDRDHRLRWPNFATLRHEQAHKAEPVAELPEGSAPDAHIPVAEGARFAAPREDRPQIQPGGGIRVTGAEGTVGPEGAQRAEGIVPSVKPDAGSEGKLSATSGTSPHSAGPAPDAKAPVRKPGDEKPQA